MENKTGAKRTERVKSIFDSEDSEDENSENSNIGLKEEIFDASSSLDQSIKEVKDSKHSAETLETIENQINSNFKIKEFQADQTHEKQENNAHIKDGFTKENEDISNLGHSQAPSIDEPVVSDVYNNTVSSTASVELNKKDKLYSQDNPDNKNNTHTNLEAEKNIYIESNFGVAREEVHEKPSLFVDSKESLIIKHAANAPTSDICYDKTINKSLCETQSTQICKMEKESKNIGNDANSDLCNMKNEVIKNDEIACKEKSEAVQQFDNKKSALSLPKSPDNNQNEETDEADDSADSDMNVDEDSDSSNMDESSDFAPLSDVWDTVNIFKGPDIYSTPLQDNYEENVSTILTSSLDKSQDTALNPNNSSVDTNESMPEKEVSTSMESESKDRNLSWEHIDDESLANTLNTQGNKNVGWESLCIKKSSKPTNKIEPKIQSQRIQKRKQKEAALERDDTSNKKSKKSGTPEDANSNLHPFMLPFEKGWVREMVYRGQQSAGNKKVDIYYYIKNQRFRSRNEVQEYLMQNNIQDLSLENFSFMKKSLNVDEKYEKIRKSAQSDSANEKPLIKNVLDSVTSASKNFKSASKILANNLPKSKPRKMPKTQKEDQVSNSQPKIVKKVLIKDTPKRPPKISAKASVPAKPKTTGLSYDRLAYCTHLIPANPPLTEPRIITPVLRGDSENKLLHCTATCEAGGGQVPNLQCLKCLCLFHSECCQMPPATVAIVRSAVVRFLCPNCYREEDPKEDEYEGPTPFEPLAFDPDSDSEDEGLVSDFDHPALHRFNFRPKTPPLPPLPPSHELSSQFSTFRNFVSHQTQNASSNNLQQDPIVFSNPRFQHLENSNPSLGGRLRPPTSSALLLYQPLFPKNNNLLENVYLPYTGKGSKTFAPMMIGQRLAPVASRGVTKKEPVDAADKGEDDSGTPGSKERRSESVLRDLSSAYRVLHEVFRFLAVSDLLAASRVCSLWRDIAMKPRYWSQVSLGGVCVKDWMKMSSFLKKMGTLELDLRDTILHSNVVSNVVESENLQPDDLKCISTSESSGKDNSEDQRIEENAAEDENMNESKSETSPNIDNSKPVTSSNLSDNKGVPSSSPVEGSDGVDKEKSDDLSNRNDNVEDQKSGEKNETENPSVLSEHDSIDLEKSSTASTGENSHLLPVVSGDKSQLNATKNSEVSLSDKESSEMEVTDKEAEMDVESMDVTVQDTVADSQGTEGKFEGTEGKTKETEVKFEGTEGKSKESQVKFNEMEMQSEENEVLSKEAQVNPIQKVVTTMEAEMNPDETKIKSEETEGNPQATETNLRKTEITPPGAETTLRKKEITPPGAEINLRKTEITPPGAQVDQIIKKSVSQNSSMMEVDEGIETSNEITSESHSIVTKKVCVDWHHVFSSLSKLKTLEKLVVDQTSMKLNDVNYSQNIAVSNRFEWSTIKELPNLEKLYLISNDDVRLDGIEIFENTSLKTLVVDGIDSQSGWPSVNINLESLGLSPVSSFNQNSWLNLSKLNSLSCLSLDGRGLNLDEGLFTTISSLSGLKRLCLMDWFIGPKFSTTLKSRPNIESLSIIPAIEHEDSKGLFSGRLLNMLEDADHLRSFIWGIRTQDLVEENEENGIRVLFVKEEEKVDSNEDQNKQFISLRSLKELIKQSLTDCRSLISVMEPKHFMIN